MGIKTVKDLEKLDSSLSLEKLSDMGAIPYFGGKDLVVCGEEGSQRIYSPTGEGDYEGGQVLTPRIR